MDHAIIRGGGPEILPRNTFVHDGVQYSPGTLDRRSREQKALLGVYEVVDVTAGSGSIQVSVDLALNGDHVTRTRTFRKRTAQEIEDSNVKRAEDLASQDFGKIQLGDIRTMFALWKLINPSGTVQQFGVFYRAARTDDTITAAAFRAEMRDILENGL